MLREQATTADANLSTSLLLKLQRRDHISDDEQRVLAKLIIDPSTAPANVDLVREGDRPTASTLILDGFAARYKVVENGGRQITALHGPGDFVDLHSYLLKQMDHGIVTLTPVRIAKAPHSALVRISETHPHLSRMFSLLTLIDGAIHREWLVAMGRRTALGHAAHLLCEVYKQLEIVNRTSGLQFVFPVTQMDFADMLGLSAVHINRVIQELRARELIAWQGAVIRILDWDGLVEVGGFDDTYLQLVCEPR
jgi:CRP-like cAMP-binding protein